LTDIQDQELVLRKDDRARDLDPSDPALADLADRVVKTSIERYSLDDLRQESADVDLPRLVQSSINASSPAWERLDTLIRAGLRHEIAAELGVAPEPSTGT
jgi:hypothetical protein